MANRNHVRRLKQGVDGWNAWRHKSIVGPDLSGVTLIKSRLGRINLDGANLSSANLRGAYLGDASFVLADLTNADLSNATLSDSNLSLATLGGANFSGAHLVRTVFRSSDFRGADVTKAVLGETVFSDCTLLDVIGLESCKHVFHSAIDLRTFEASGPLPLSFLRGAGLPENFISYMPSLFDQAIRHYSCFISYSSKDEEFAYRLHADLQNNDVRCWFAPHDMPIGGRIFDEIDAAIRLRDKVLLILSKHSIKSDWVEDEITKAFEEERSRDRTVLFPIRLDDAVMDTDEPWAGKLRRDRNIGDFRRWKEHDEYQKSFERVLRDLTVKKP